MIDLGYNEMMIGKGNIPKFFLTDRRFPIEEVTQNLKPFDEISYISRIAFFIQSNLSQSKDNTLIFDIYNLGLSMIYSRYLKKILEAKTDYSAEQISKMKRSEIISVLYKLGCPKLYCFHKTAKETTTYSYLRRKILPNP